MGFLRTILAILYLVMIHLSCLAQDCILDYRSPINHETILSGSYGEPRTRHFHAGIDYKQYRGVPRDSIFGIADGFISRINVQPDGYGNALYIDHNCNKTSVYAHLYDFAPPIRDYINAILYQKKQYKITHFLDEDSLKISKGDFIGILGNTGRSSGPHLHFEIRNTSTETPINPALIGLKPQDDIAPVIVGIYIYTLSPDNEELSKAYYPADKISKLHYSINDGLIQSNAYKIGIGIRTYDQMNGAHNHNGIYRLNMKVDGTSAYSFKLDSVPFDQAKYIHTHMDYEEKENKKYVTKCYLSPINKLPIYDTDEQLGVVFPFEFKSTNIEITVADIENNQSKISFDMIRDSKTHNGTYEFDSLSSDMHKYRIRPQDSVAIYHGPTEVTLYKETVSNPTDIYLGPVSPDVIDLRQKKPIATFRSFKVRHHVDRLKAPKTKYILSSVDEKGRKHRHKVRWESDSVLVSFLSDFKKYSLTLDTTPPMIKIVSLPNSQKTTFKFLLTDDYVPAHFTDDLEYSVYLDEQWVLCQHDAKTETIWFDINKAQTINDHTIVVRAKDASHNMREVIRKVTF